MKQKSTYQELENKIKDLEYKLNYRDHMLAETQSLSKTGSWDWNVLTNQVEWTDMIFFLLGLAPNELPPSYELALQYVHHDDKERYQLLLEEAVSQKSSYYMENRITKKDGSTIPVISQGICQLNDKGNLIRMIGTVQDISEQKTLLNQLKKEKELNELKSQFVSTASHEFRTPLTAILSSVHLAERCFELKKREKFDKHVTTIKSSVKKLVNILDDFLSLDKLEAGKVITNATEVNNIEKIANEAISATQGFWKEGQSINYKHVGKKEVIIDAKLLGRVLINLLSNAIKYSNSEVHLDTEHTEQNLRVQVRDTGIGIPLKEQQNMYGLFFRASNVSNIQGTGLGLNIVRKHIELMKGTISFESELNRGTTFFVKIPQKL